MLSSSCLTLSSSSSDCRLLASSSSAVPAGIPCSSHFSRSTLDCGKEGRQQVRWYLWAHTFSRLAGLLHQIHHSIVQLDHWLTPCHGCLLLLGQATRIPGLCFFYIFLFHYVLKFSCVIIENLHSTSLVAKNQPNNKPIKQPTKQKTKSCLTHFLFQ